VYSQRLGSTARRAISNASDIWFSVASGWELMIKRALGKLTLPFGESISEQLETDGFRSLPVTLDHVETLHSLPDLHRDPFDRMLIAQARFEGLTIVTADDQIARYSVHVIDATN
jgi:PIN domain nuclease of toxin-antitoxin system